MKDWLIGHNDEIMTMAMNYACGKDWEHKQQMDAFEIFLYHRKCVIVSDSLTISHGLISVPLKMPFS